MKRASLVLLLLAWATAPQANPSKALPSKPLPWRASGAGLADVNGLYVHVGTYNGEPLYRHQYGGGHTYLFWMDSCWVIGLVVGPLAQPHYLGGDGLVLPANPWKLPPGPPLGDPPPTLANAGPPQSQDGQ